MRPGLVVVVLALAASGCAGPGEPAGDSGGASPLIRVEAQANETMGAVLGIVTDEEQAPIEGAVAALGEGLPAQAVNTTAAGEFVFNDVEPGLYKLFVQKLGFESHGTKVQVVAGEVAYPKIVLVRLTAAPAFPIEFRMESVRTAGGWFPVPYSEAARFLPPGFAAKPHVLLDPNDQVAELDVYIVRYGAVLLEGATLPEGYWSFQVLSVVPPEPHNSGATVEFILLGSHASDPVVADLLSKWRIPTQVGELSFVLTEAVPDQAYAMTGSVRAGTSGFGLAVADAVPLSGVSGGSLSVRMFGLREMEVLNYVELDIASVQYSITGAARIDGMSGLAITPAVTVGEGYVQWGSAANQVLRYDPL